MHCGCVQGADTEAVQVSSDPEGSDHCQKLKLRTNTDAIEQPSLLIVQSMNAPVPCVPLEELKRTI